VIGLVYPADSKNTKPTEAWIEITPHENFSIGLWLFLAAAVLAHGHIHANHDKLFIDCVHADPDVVSFEVCADIFGVDGVDLDGVDTNWYDTGPDPK
jgi:hypothetical protein